MRNEIEKKYRSYYEDGRLSLEEWEGLCNFLEHDQNYQHMYDRYQTISQIIRYGIVAMSVGLIGRLIIHADSMAHYISILHLYDIVFLLPRTIILLFLAYMLIYVISNALSWIMHVVMKHKNVDVQALQSDIIGSLLDSSSFPLHDFSYDRGDTAYPYTMRQLVSTIPWLRRYDRLKKFADTTTVSGTTSTYQTPYTAHGIEIHTQRRHKNKNSTTYTTIDYCYLFCIAFDLPTNISLPRVTLLQEFYKTTGGRRKRTSFGWRYFRQRMVSAIIAYWIFTIVGNMLYPIERLGMYNIWILLLLRIIIGLTWHYIRHTNEKNSEVGVVDIDFDKTFLLKADDQLAAREIFSTSVIHRLRKRVQLLHHRALSLFLEKNKIYMKIDLRRSFYRTPTIGLLRREKICDSSIEAFIAIRELMMIPDILHLDPYIVPMGDSDGKE